MTEPKKSLGGLTPEQFAHLQTLKTKQQRESYLRNCTTKEKRKW